MISVEGPAVSYSRRALKIQNLSDFLGVDIDWRPVALPFDRYRSVIAWGRRPKALYARRVSESCRMPLYTIEDGFVRSVGRHDPPLSIVVDDLGIYFDAAKPSRLETLVDEDLSSAEMSRAWALTELWRNSNVSKYNDAQELKDKLPLPYILVCDQTFGDASITYGGADVTTFFLMLDAALREYPDHHIVVKTHPDTKVKGKRGFFSTAALEGEERVYVLNADCHPSGVIERADAVYTVTSQMGFEALIWGKRVRCFGMPFYAGWGLTDDELPAPDRRKPVTFAQLVHASLVKYPRYIDPVTLKRCEPERSIAHVGLQRRKRHEFPQQIVAIGFSRWKRPFIQRFLKGSDMVFAKTPPAVLLTQSSLAIALWGSAEAPAPPSNAPILRIEDGFLRSSGLGSDLVRPLSLVIDDIGIYYDATRPSRLERILETEVLDDPAVSRADELRDRIVELDLTKYNLDREAWDRPNGLSTVILVVGQVETDASIRLGSPEIRSNTELLRRVRQENPSAHIVYKPHPDVLAGLRRQGDGEWAALAFADEVIARPVSLNQLLGQVDEVHTMTSLLGFEALIRGVKVVCHGLPFYAGWGLTEDRISCSRRTRRLTVAELVHGALISYPRYFNYERECFVEPEQAVEQLAAMANRGPQRRSLHRKFVRGAIVAWLKLKGSTR